MNKTQKSVGMTDAEWDLLEDLSIMKDVSMSELMRLYINRGAKAEMNRLKKFGTAWRETNK